MSKDEVVLCVRRSFLEESLCNGKPLFQGFAPLFPEFKTKVLQRHDQMVWANRAACENDPSLKQIIPVVVIRYETRYTQYLFLYTRSKGQGEQRLHGLSTVCVGGHINQADCPEKETLLQNDHLFNNIVLNAAHRELYEEVQFYGRVDLSPYGLVNDDTNDVGKVHLGLIYILRLRDPSIHAKELSMANPHLRDINSIHGNPKISLEPWAQIIVDAIYLGK